MADDKQMSTRISKELHQKVRIKSVKTNKSISQVIREKLKEWAEDDKDD